MHTHHLSAHLLHLLIAILCLCSVVSAAEPPVQPPPPAAEQQLGEAPPAAEPSALQSVALKISILAAAGVVLALIPSTRMNLFENGVDIFFTCVASCIFCVLLVYDDGQETLSLSNRLLGMLVLAGLLIPYALIANGGKIWTLLVILPARLVVAVLVVACGIFFFFSAVAAIAGRRQSKGIFSASLFGLATFGLTKLIRNTTKSYRQTQTAIQD